jgi:hypothetical protein
VVGLELIAGESGLVVVPFMGESIEDGSLIAILKRKWLH